MFAILLSMIYYKIAFNINVFQQYFRYECVCVKCDEGTDL